MGIRYDQEPALTPPLLDTDIFCISRSPYGIGAPFQKAQMSDVLAYINAGNNAYTITPYIVGLTSATAPYFGATGIQDAIDAAALVATSTTPKIVFIQAGVYSQSAQLKNWVSLLTIPGAINPGNSLVTLQGQLSFDTTQPYNGVISGISVDGSGVGAGLSITGTQSINADFINFEATASDFDAFECSNPNANLFFSEFLWQGQNANRAFNITDYGALFCQNSEINGNGTACYINSTNVAQFFFFSTYCFQPIQMDGKAFGVVTNMLDVSTVGLPAFYLASSDNVLNFAGNITNVFGGTYMIDGVAGATVNLGNSVDAGISLVNPILTVNLIPMSVGSQSFDAGQSYLTTQLFNGNQILKIGGTQFVNTPITTNMTPNTQYVYQNSLNGVFQLPATCVKGDWFTVITQDTSPPGNFGGAQIYLNDNQYIVSNDTVIQQLTGFPAYITMPYPGRAIKLVCIEDNNVFNVEYVLGQVDLTNNDTTTTTINQTGIMFGDLATLGFNTTNLQAPGGILDTIQDIDSSATPTFVNINYTFANADDMRIPFFNNADQLDASPNFTYDSILNTLVFGSSNSSTTSGTSIIGGTTNTLLNVTDGAILASENCTLTGTTTVLGAHQCSISASFGISFGDSTQYCASIASLNNDAVTDALFSVYLGSSQASITDDFVIAMGNSFKGVFSNVLGWGDSNNDPFPATRSDSVYFRAQNGFLITDSSGGAFTDDSAMLELSSTLKGFYAPRMDTTQQNSIPSPNIGLHLFNTTAELPYWYTSGGWKFGDLLLVSTQNQNWIGAIPSTAGNINYQQGSNFITLDIPAVSATATTSTTIVNSTPLDPQLCPLVNKTVVICGTDNSSSVFLKCVIDTAGVITIGVGSSGSNFTGAGTTGFESFSVSYQI